MSLHKTSREIIEQENRERLQNTLRIARETEKIGAETCQELHSQTEQIHRIAEKTQNINHNLNQSKRIVRGMSGFMGRVKNWFSKAPKEPEPIIQSVASVRRDKEESKQVVRSSEIKIVNTSQTVTPPEESKKLGMNAYYTPEEEQVLDEIEKHVLTIKDMAYNIGDTLEYHNNVLDLITDQTHKNTQDMHTIDRKIRRLM